MGIIVYERDTVLVYPPHIVKDWLITVPMSDLGLSNINESVRYYHDNYNATRGIPRSEPYGEGFGVG